METLIKMMAPIYASLITKGELSIETIPKVYREAVQEYMKNNGK